MIPKPGPREYALALLSAFVSAAITGGFPLIAVLAARGEGPPLEDRDVIAGSIVVAVSLAAVVVILRAIFRRQRRGFLGGGRLKGGPEAHGAELLVGMPELVGLARACGVVAVVGLGCGLWLGWKIRRDFVVRLLDDAETWCGTPSVLGFPDEAVCIERARVCIREGWTLPSAAIARADSLRQAFVNQRLAIERDAAEKSRRGEAVSDWDAVLLARLADHLKDSKESPKLAQARQAALVCLADAGGRIR